MTTMVTRKLVFELYPIIPIGLAILWLIATLWLILFLGVYIGYGNYKVLGHQEFAANCVSQIEPAAQMNQLFEDCRHYITYAGDDGHPLFNTVAYFGGRYELTMQVPVDIHSRASGMMVDEPKFYLNELRQITVEPSGQVGASFSRNFNFGFAQWKEVYKTNGNWNAIGIDLNPSPVEDFQKYAAATRPSN
ncbi:MAG: hypothetical protein JWM11_4017 [Planctomycetaceae bacterium]|nr:hypothetical protein [Planctomycetaceae bacterium]